MLLRAVLYCTAAFISTSYSTIHRKANILKSTAHSQGRECVDRHISRSETELMPYFPSTQAPRTAQKRPIFGKAASWISMKCA